MLVLACQNLQSLSDQVIASPEAIHTLDLTSNSLSSGAELRPFTGLVHLVIDRNSFIAIDDFPVLKSLETFSANKNQFSNFQYFLDCAKKKFPKLTNLSLVNNPICPYFEGGKEYEAYKAKVVSYFPNLETLDGGYIGKAGCVVNIESKKTTGKSVANKGVEEGKMAESVQAFKKEAKGYKIKDMAKTVDQEQAHEEDEEDADLANEKRLLSVIEFNEKYTNKPARNMKLRSEGNRFVRNDQL